MGHRKHASCDSPIRANVLPDTLGFDYNGATFSHAGGLVTLEVLLASFDLGRLVHFLNERSMQPPEAAGVESVLTGLRETVTSDDQLLDYASKIFDGLLAAFSKSNKNHKS